MKKGGRTLKSSYCKKHSIRKANKITQNISMKKKSHNVSVALQPRMPNGFTPLEREQLKEFEQKIIGK